MSFESYDEAQQQQQELTQTHISPALSSVFGSSSLGTLGSSAAFSPTAYTPPVVPRWAAPGGAVGPLCVGEGAIGLPMSTPHLMHNQQHSPSTLERLEQMKLLQQAQMMARMQQQQQQQQATMSGAPGFGAIGAERARRDSHTSSSGVSGSGASYNLLASAAAAAGLDSSFTQLMKLESAAAGMCAGAGVGVGEAHEQLCYAHQSCFESHLSGSALQPQPKQNGLGLSAEASMRMASAQWPVGDSKCSSDPRALGGQQHF